MPRASLASQVECGMLSPGTCAKLINRSANTIRNLIAKEKLLSIRTEGRGGEVRVSALELLLHLINNGHPFKKDLAVAAVKYATAFQYSHLAYAQEVLRTYDDYTPRQRMDIPLVMNTEEIVVWDDDGKIIQVPDSEEKSK